MAAWPTDHRHSRKRQVIKLVYLRFKLSRQKSLRLRNAVFTKLRKHLYKHLLLYVRLTVKPKLKNTYDTVVYFSSDIKMGDASYKNQITERYQPTVFFLRSLNSALERTEIKTTRESVQRQLKTRPFELGSLVPIRLIQGCLGGFKRSQPTF